MASVRITPALHKTGVRHALAPRREPHWGAPLSRGLYVGFRKIDAERGSWIARRFDEETRKHSYKSLGWATVNFDYDKAKVDATAWAAALCAHVTDKVVTVSDACKQYVTDRRRVKGEQTAHDAEIRFKKRVYDDALGSRSLAKVRTALFYDWIGRCGSPSTALRMWRSLEAALNLAVRNRQVPATVAQEWRDVKAPTSAGKRRDLYLDITQRRALRDAAKGNVRDLIEAVILTGARAGELTSALRRQFDSRTKSMTFIGKTGSRTVPLSDAAVALFKRMSESKLPNANLFVRDDGKPWAHSDWDELVRDAATSAGLPKGTHLYALRHSFITQAISDGLNTLDVARIVGTSLTMIERHYGHLVASAARERMAKVTML